MISDPHEIRSEQRKFYEQLYKDKIDYNSDKYRDAEDLFMNDTESKTLTQEEIDICEKEITEIDLLKALKELKNDKTPGTTGLPADFYKFFWHDFKDILLDSIHYSFETGSLSIEQ